MKEIDKRAQDKRDGLELSDLDKEELPGQDTAGKFSGSSPMKGDRFDSGAP